MSLAFVPLCDCAIFQDITKNYNQIFLKKTLMKK